MSLFLNTKEDILKNVGKQSSSGAPLTSIVFFPYYGSQWFPKTACLQTFPIISSFVFSRTKTCIQVWNYLRVSKWWQNFHFSVNYPFKKKILNMNRKEKEEIKNNYPINDFKTERRENTLHQIKRRDKRKENLKERENLAFALVKYPHARCLWLG